MIRSPGSLMAEDVTVRCRVRKCPASSHPEPWKTDTTETALFQEMTCTMRHWENCRRPRRSVMVTHAVQGPELLLTPVSHARSSWSTVRAAQRTLDHPNVATTPPRPRRRRAASTSACRVSPVSHATLPPSTLPFAIAVHDIVGVCATLSSPSSSPKATCTSRLFLQTRTTGTFELDCLSHNGHDIILAFLQASLLPACIQYVRDATLEPPTDDVPSSSSVTSCLDVDTLQARHLQGRADAETWPEKFSRRVGLVVNNLSQLWDGTASKQIDGTPAASSNRFLCCCIGEADVSTIATPTAANTSTRSQRSASPFQRYTAAASFPYTPMSSTRELELDEAKSTPRAAAAPPMRQRTLGRMPSGLSVEPDPDQ